MPRRPSRPTVAHRRCLASYAYQAYDIDIAGTIHDALQKVWHVWGRTGEKHHAMFFLEQPAVIGQNQRLVIELHHKEFNEGINLGRFRLSVTGNATSVWEEELLTTGCAGLAGYPLLASAYLIAGDPAKAIEVASSPAWPEAEEGTRLALRVLPSADSNRGNKPNRPVRS